MLSSLEICTRKTLQEETFSCIKDQSVEYNELNVIKQKSLFPLRGEFKCHVSGRCPRET